MSGNGCKQHKNQPQRGCTRCGEAAYRSFAAPHGSAWTTARIKPKRDGQYVCLTNYGDVFVIWCTMGEWDRPARFNDGEYVEWWIPAPCSPEAEACHTPRINTHTVKADARESASVASSALMGAVNPADKETKT